MAGAAVFDVNETMLDLSSLGGIFERVFGDRAAQRAWFARMLHTSLAVTATGEYDSFAALGRASLLATAEAAGVDVDEATWDKLAAGMSNLPAYPDVEPGLVRLGEAGWTRVALTNSSQVAAEAQLTNARLADHFDHILSVERVGRFKPFPEPYGLAIETTGRSAGDVWMVAAHDWDLAGAAAAGMATAFVARQSMPYSPAYPQPTLRVSGLDDLADQLLD